MGDATYPLAAAAVITALAIFVAAVRSFRPIRFDITIHPPKENPPDEHNPDGRR